MTKREELAGALRALGEREVSGRSRRYLCFTATAGKSVASPGTGGSLDLGAPRFWFLGKAGALRLGATVTASLSMEPLRGVLVRRAGLVEASRGVIAFLSAPLPCAGCELTSHQAEVAGEGLQAFRVTGFDGDVAERVLYCRTCAELAGVNWNGETARIEEAR